MLHGLHHVLGDIFPRVRPQVEHRAIAFLLGHQSAVMALLELHDLFFGIGNKGELRIRGHQVIGTEGQTALGGLAEAQLVHVIQQVDRRLASKSADSSR